MLSDIEKKVIAAIQEEIPIAARPYLAIATRIGISEDTLLETLRDLCRRGVIRRFGATLRHQRSGYRANAMTAWQVPEAQVEAAGRIMATWVQVSHCYRRDPVPGWPYNLYTMIHAADEAQCRRIAAEIAAAAGVENYTLLFSRQELKKTSMLYFSDEEL
jgi:DNA-binding Lrp family transcriptional regulator